MNPTDIDAKKEINFLSTMALMMGVEFGLRIFAGNTAMPSINETLYLHV